MGLAHFRRNHARHRRKLVHFRRNHARFWVAPSGGLCIPAAAKPRSEPGTTKRVLGTRRLRGDQWGQDVPAPWGGQASRLDPFQPDLVAERLGTLGFSGLSRRSSWAREGYVSVSNTTGRFSPLNWGHWVLFRGFPLLFDEFQRLTLEALILGLSGLLRVEPTVGIEPTTGGLQNRCSTAELCWHSEGSR